MLRGPESGLDRLDSLSVRVGELVKDGAKRRRLRRSAILDKFINTNNRHPSDQGRHPDRYMGTKCTGHAVARAEVLEESRPNQESVEDAAVEIIPLGPGFAAELRGVTLADVAADDAVYAAVRAAFEDHSVLLFRGQEVSGEGQLAFSRRFGPPEVTKVGSVGTGTNFVILTTIGDDGKVVPEDHRYAMRNKANQLWHTDSSFKAVPALTSVLSARTIPDHG